MSNFQLLFRGNSLFLKGETKVLISENFKSDNIRFMGYGTKGYVNSFCFFYINEQKEIIFHPIKDDKIGEPIVIDHTDSCILAYQFYRIYYEKNNRSYCCSLDTFVINETNEEFNGLMLDSRYTLEKGCIKRKKDNRVIGKDFSSYSCGWHYLAFIKNNELIVYDNFSDKGFLNLGSAEKIICGFECLFFLSKGKVYFLGKNPHFNGNEDKPIFLFEAENFCYKRNILSIFKKGKWYYCGDNKNNKISVKYKSEPIFIGDFSPIKERWTLENHKFYSDKLKKNIFIFLLINSKNKGVVKIPKFVLFEIFKFL